MWRRLARYEYAEEWKILHAQDAHKLYIHTVQRRDEVVVVAGIAVDVVVEGDSCMKKDQSAAAEKNRRRTMQQMDMVHRA
jgi:hypothetical protein